MRNENESLLKKTKRIEFSISAILFRSSFSQVFLRRINILVKMKLRSKTFISLSRYIFFIVLSNKGNWRDMPWSNVKNYFAY